MTDYFSLSLNKGIKKPIQIPDTFFNLGPINATQPGFMADQEINKFTTKFQILDIFFNIGHKSRTKLEIMAYYFSMTF